ncbi:MAG: DUF424 family protein [Sulfolobales archaeon]|nr:DUF424 family protein [Sulfolobales archaeon]MCX8185760.1 DUF424 family protein [Sulfolobales archaeon]MDW7970032.1 DUF424 family protein [Sulfolobales archaeon]
MFVYVKIYYEGSDQSVLAVCDEEILGMVLREGDVVLDVSKDFFNGFKTHLDDLPHLLEGVNSAMLVGNNAVRKAIEAGYVHPEAVLKVGQVPYAYLVKI